MAHHIIPDIVKNQKICDMLETATALDAARFMAERNVGAVVVTDENCRMIGIVTERDLTRKITAAGRDPKETPLSTIMTRGPDALAPKDSPRDALELMQERHIRHLPVVEDGTVIGIVSVRDLLSDALATMERKMVSADDFLRRLVY
jgi:CBS domain-containing protein